MGVTFNHPRTTWPSFGVRATSNGSFKSSVGCAHPALSRGWFFQFTSRFFRIFATLLVSFRPPFHHQPLAPPFYFFSPLLSLLPGIRASPRYCRGLRVVLAVAKNFDTFLAVDGRLVLFRSRGKGTNRRLKRVEISRRGWKTSAATAHRHR